MNKPILLFFSLFISVVINAQTEKELNQVQDSLFIQEVESKQPDKVLHAEPLFIDLIRDLGARKGEKEWNVGLGIADNINYDKYTALVEYEWAPINRLGLEVELPFSIYYPTGVFKKKKKFFFSLFRVDLRVFLINIHQCAFLVSHHCCLVPDICHRVCHLITLFPDCLLLLVQQRRAV